MSEVLKGACLCGGVEYEVQDPQALGYCHCTRCQHWTGSSLAGVVVAKENFRFTKGEDLVKTYESELAPRNFCSNCGSSLYDDLGTSERLRLHRRAVESLEELYRGFEKELLVPLWTEIGDLMPAHPQSKAQPHLWRWIQAHIAGAQVDQLLHPSAGVVEHA